MSNTESLFRIRTDEQPRWSEILPISKEYAPQYHTVEVGDYKHRIHGPCALKAASREVSQPEKALVIVIGHPWTHVMPGDFLKLLHVFRPR